MFDLSKNVGYQIQKYRKEKGLTQKQLSEKIGSNQKSLSDWERGQAEVSLKNLQKISEVLGVHVSMLLSEENKENSLQKEVADLKNRMSILEKSFLNNFGNENIHTSGGKNAVGKVGGNVGVVG